MTDLEKELLSTWEDIKRKKMESYKRRVEGIPAPVINQEL